MCPHGPRGGPGPVTSPPAPGSPQTSAVAALRREQRAAHHAQPSSAARRAETRCRRHAGRGSRPSTAAPPQPAPSTAHKTAGGDPRPFRSNGCLHCSQTPINSNPPYQENFLAIC